MNNREIENRQICLMLWEQMEKLKSINKKLKKIERYLKSERKRIILEK